MSRLVEFENHRGELLRGILDEAASDRAIVFVHGFERTTIESKFKHIVDALKGQVNLFRFDFSGCGLSDGSFEDLTVEKLSQELACTVNSVQRECSSVCDISFVGFSLGACIITKYLSEHTVEPNKLLFFAPGFNQKQLLRYFFTRQQHRDTIIRWDNFTSYLDENAFQADAQRTRRIMKEHYLSGAYFMENFKKDYSEDFLSLTLEQENVFMLQGTDDNKVPPASNEIVYKQYPPLLVQGGDHDLSRPDMVEQYLSLVIDFLQS